MPFYTNLKLAWLNKKEKARFFSEAGFGLVENIGVTLFYRLSFEDIAKPKAFSYAILVFSFYTNLKQAWLS